MKTKGSFYSLNQRKASQQVKHKKLTAQQQLHLNKVLNPNQTQNMFYDAKSGIANIKISNQEKSKMNQFPSKR